MPSIERRIVLTKGPPWGFRLYVDNRGILTISKIRRHSPAETAKLHAGDQLITLNGRPARSLSHAEAVYIIDTTIGMLDILISRFESTSTKVLMFDKVDCKLPDDMRTNLHMDLHPYQSFDEDQNDYFMEGPTMSPSRTIIKRSPEVATPPSKQQSPARRLPQLDSLDTQDLVDNPEILHIQHSPSPPHSQEQQVPEIKPLPISKLIKEYDINSSEANSFPDSQKKHYGDSAFYHDANNIYPTIEEQIGMARRVAASLTASDNIMSRGAAIFDRQKKRADKHTIQNEPQFVQHVYSTPDKSPSPLDLAHWPQMAPAIAKSPTPPPIYRLGYSTGPPPPPPGSVPPPPPLPSTTRTLPEFLEKAKQFPRSKHDNVTPGLCHDIAAALHSSNSRGAQLFAQKKNKSHKWEVKSAVGTAERPLEVSMAVNPGPAQLRSQPRVTSIVRPQNGNDNTADNGSYYANRSANPGENFNNSAPTPRVPANQFYQATQPANYNSQPIVASAVAPAAPFTSHNPSVANLPSTSNQQPTNKWKPVKFNMPQKA